VDAGRAGRGVSPDGMQRLLRRADRDVDGVRDDVRGYVTGQLGDPGGVLIADETGFVKKGTRSAGVQRQYSGTAGRTENCQVGVFLAYASVHGHALIDRELCLPRSWTEDRDRCREAGIPGETEFATRPRLAQAMIGRALEAGVPFSWFTADEAYGQAKWLQAWLEGRGVSYVMAIRRSGTLTVPAGERRADALIAAVPARAWQKISAGAGAHGPREYHWARVPVRPGWERGRGHWRLARRSLTDPNKCRCSTKGPGRAPAVHGTRRQDRGTPMPYPSGEEEGKSTWSPSFATERPDLRRNQELAPPRSRRADRLSRRSHAGAI
jgi:DDE superfamily endonuclease